MVFTLLYIPAYFVVFVCFLMILRPPRSTRTDTLFPYTTLFRSIAPSVGDIFYSNAIKNGLLPIRLPAEAVERIWAIAEADPAAPLAVDLVAQTVRPAKIGRAHV